MVRGMVCLGCHVVFLIKRSDAKTCSPKCRKAWQRVKEKIRAEVRARYVECGECGMSRLRSQSGPCAICGAREALMRERTDAEPIGP